MHIHRYAAIWLGSAALILALGAPPAHGFTLKPYGYIKADLTMDMGKPNVAPDNDGGFGTNYVRWLDAMGKDEDRPMTWGLTARQSRLGFDFIGDKIGETEVMGRIETDFTNGAGEYTNIIKLRKAFLKVSTPTMELLAGQEADIHSPMVPNTVNYLVGWWAGNIGFRRPQIRFTYKMPMGEGSGLDIAVGVERSMPSGGKGDNYDVALPLLAGRIGYRSPMFSLGVSGHYGSEREKLGTDPNLVNEEFTTYSANVDLIFNPNKMISLSGEFYYGVNLDTFFGGIGQGVVLNKDGKGEEVTDMGFWAELKVNATDRMVIHAGQTMTMLDEEQLAPKSRTGNMSTYANINFMMAKDVWVALEVSRWATTYKVDEPQTIEETSDDFRGQLAFIYNFK